MPGPPGVDRRDPLPGIADLPRWLRRNVPPRVRRALLVLLALVVVGLAVVIPVLVSGDRRRAVREARAERAVHAARAREVRRAQRPHVVVLPDRGRAPALRAGLERAVLADARGRHRSGELPDPVFRVSCAPFGNTAPGPRPRVLILECLGLSRLGRTGYPFRARLVVATGQATWCRNILDTPDEGVIPLSPRCTATSPRGAEG